MGKESDIQAAYDEVLKKIGRNLLAFQEEEQILKAMLKLGSFAMSAGEPEVSFQTFTRRVQTMTLGGLTTLFTEKHFSNNEPALPDLMENSDEITVAMSFSFNFVKDVLAERRESLATLVEERNKLAHHILPGFDRNSLESCHAMAADLDRQHELVISGIKRLNEDYRIVQQVMKDLAVFAASPEGLKTMVELPLEHHPLIKEFSDIAQVNPVPDGWTSLNTAANSITGFSRAEISEICANFGHASLTALMIASQTFDIYFEPAGNDRHRVFYRLKHAPLPVPFD